MPSCSAFSPRLVTEENCQLRASDSWLQHTGGGFRKNDRFCSRETDGVGGGVKHCMWEKAHLCATREPTNLGIRTENVVPQDGSPTSRQLDAIGDHNHREGGYLEQTPRGSGGGDQNGRQNHLHATQTHCSPTSSSTSRPGWQSLVSKLMEWSSSVTMSGPWNGKHG